MQVSSPSHPNTFTTYKVLDIGVASSIQERLDSVKVTRARREMEDSLAVLKWKK